MTENQRQRTLSDVLSLLEHSQDRLAAAVARLPAAELAGPSYASDWSIAQVLSHLGSGAEIFSSYVDAGRDGTAMPEQAAFEKIWHRWDTKPPADQVRDGLAAGADFINLIAGMDGEAAKAWRLDLFGAVRDLTEITAMRVTEHALHTWDVIVMQDPTATVSPDAVDLIIDRLDLLVQYTARPADQALDVDVVTHAPDRRWRLRSSDGAVSMTAGDGPATAATLTLPAEALIRLVYGRLDHDHVSGVEVAGVDLDTLRRVFPGP